jgi:hypothetical protein
MGEQNAAAKTFADALRTGAAALAEVPALLEGARVHEAAFGKLFEAAEVRDAYHQRLPETEQDIVEALEVIEHFVVGLTGGHAIGARQAGQVSQTSGGVAGPASTLLAPSVFPVPAVPPVFPVQQTGGSKS